MLKLYKETVPAVTKTYCDYKGCKFNIDSVGRVKMIKCDNINRADMDRLTREVKELIIKGKYDDGDN